MLRDVAVVLKDVDLFYPLWDRGSGVRDRIAKQMVSFLKGIKFNEKQTKFHALRSINLRIMHGERVAFLGHNGAGKSTLLRLVAGLFPHSSGELEVCGTKHALLTMGAGIDSEFTGRENVARICRLYGLKALEIQKIIQEVLIFSELGEAFERPMKTYSDGMRVRLMFSVYTSFKSDILIMDEMIGAGDAHFMEKATKRAKEFYEQASTVLLATHAPELAKSFCMRGVILNHGSIVFDGNISDAITIYRNGTFSK